MTRPVSKTSCDPSRNFLKDEGILRELPISVYPGEPVTRAFLEKMGFTNCDLMDGWITRGEAENAQINIEQLEAVARLKNNGEGDYAPWATTQREKLASRLRQVYRSRFGQESRHFETRYPFGPRVAYLSSDDIREFERLTKPWTQLVPPLFSDDKCPGRGISGAIILRRMLGDLKSSAVRGHSVTTENDCNYPEAYPKFTLTGIHFRDKTAPGPLPVFGQGVDCLETMYPDGSVQHIGSAVAIPSPSSAAETLFLSARHVFFDEKGKMRFIIIRTSDGHRFPVTADNLRRVDRQHDLVLFSIPGARELQRFKLSTKDPLPGLPVWVVGFPMTDYDEQRTTTSCFLSVRTYTMGAVSAFGGGMMTMTPFITGGNSGGAIINEDGKLLGIVSAYKAGLALFDKRVVVGREESYGFQVTPEFTSFVEGGLDIGL